MWAVQGIDGDDNTKLIVLGFVNKTVVFSWNDGSYSTWNEPGLDLNTGTIYIGRLKDNSLIQITSNGFRHITKNNVRPMTI